MMWSEEAEAFMRENYPHHSAEWMSDAIEQRFGERLNPTAIRQKAYRMGIKVTKKRLSDASKEHRTAEIGRMNTWSKGYKFIRTKDGWVSYGKYLLEQATHEEIPKDYAIVFADGDMVEMTPEIKELFDSWVSLTAEQKKVVMQMIRTINSNK